MKHSGQPRLCRPSFFNVVLAHGLVLLLLLTPCTQAGDILRMGGGAGAGVPDPASTPAANPGAIDTAAATAQARANAQDMLARNTMALQAVTAMQEAARAAAAGANNAGANPNFPGQTLPDVPNGLGVGGLDLISVAGALTPQQSLENARTIVNIQQQQQQAMLEWNTFNIGRETTVRFDQSAGGESAGSWIAFNRITDPSGNPTQILGSIEAQGQVYVINQNGIIFGGGSVVNTHTLVASSLPINDNLIARGLLNNPDAQFLFSANAQAAGTKGPTPAYTPPSPPASGRIGNVTVQAGARITAPTSSANVGGRVALIGPNVTNEGTISTPDGQTILAAGMEVGFDAHSSDDPSLRGLDVYVGDVGSYGGTATNAGLIESPRGSVVITGKNVNQNGFINSTTSAALNGRIDLLANYNAIPNLNYNPSDSNFGNVFLYQSGASTGIVSTGIGSVMQILPEYASALKVVGTELALKSQINMQGLGIHLGMNSVVMAPNADVALSAGVWDLVTSSGTPQLDFVQAGGQVYFDQGAVVDVSGSTAISSSISQYILTVVLRGAELADSALQRNGGLRGQTVTVDLREHGIRADGSEWVGTPLANLTGYLGVIERNVGELTVAGGTVSIKAGDSVVMQDGARVDVSGGYQDFAAGEVATTKLVHEGNLVDIADARADILYDGIFTPGTSTVDPRWGTTTTSAIQFASASHYENAHSVGGDGGSIKLDASAMALDGSLVGRTITGPQQLQAAPRQSSLELHFRAQVLSRSPLEFPYYSPTPPDIEFRTGASGLPAADAFALNGGGAPVALRQERRDTVILSPDLLTTQGFGSLLVENWDGDISVPVGVALTAPATGSIIFRGANIDIQGSIIAPGGTIDLIAYNVSPYTTAVLGIQGPGAIIPPVNPARGRVTVGPAGRLSTAGLVVDDRRLSDTRSLVPLDVTRVNADGSVSHLSTMAGGSISIESFIAEMAAGSVLDVSGGFLIDQNADVTYSNAGTLTLKAGRDPLLTSLMGGHLTLGGTLSGFSGADGGSLTLQAPMIQVGGTLAHADALLLQSEFFNQGGFAGFNLIGLGIDVTPPGGAETFLPGVLISAGAVIRPQVRSLQATVAPQGGPNTLSVETLLRPEGYRTAATLHFEAGGVTDFVTDELDIRGAIVTQAGSVIETDALGSVSFEAQTVQLLGSVIAPGGTITVTGDSRYPQNTAPTAAFATVHLGAGSLLSTAGKTVLLQDPYGRRTGHVYAGGSVSVSGNIVAETGAVLDVSGTSAVLDLLPEQSGVANVFTAGLTQAALFPGTGVTQPVQLAQAVATQIDSNGGTLTLQGSDFLFSNATLRGQAGGSTATGGTLNVLSERFIAPGGTNDDKDITMLVAQNMAQFVQPVFAGGNVIGSALVNSTGGAIQGMGYFGVDSFTVGGFDSLALAGNVQFVGPTNVTAAGYLKVADGGVLAADDLVRLSASYVALGRPLMVRPSEEDQLNPFFVTSPGTGTRPSVFGPTYGSGRLEVTADLIETGFLSLQNIGQASLTARQDLRGSGSFDMAGHLSITAGQVYPVTASTFTITAYDYTVGGVATNGSVTIASSGVTPEFPLSGGGRLNIYASTITQGGTLRAPLGTIRLGWDGSGTAPKGVVTGANVPVAQQITLQNGGVTSVSAIDPQTGAGVRIPYGIIKDGTNWIDPTGLDITSTGAPDKTIRVSGANVTTEAGSTLDIRGGGELYGFRWVEGNGGTNDILDTTGSYAILPGYGSFFAPFAPFATGGVNVANLGGDAGYVHSGLSIGDRIFLKAAPGVAEGVYTLLPARYALLPGAMLVTPDASPMTVSQVKPGGAILTSGYLFNSLNPAATNRIYEQFEVAPQRVVKVRSEYADYTANVFIPAAQQRLSLPVTVTSSDGGYALLSAQQTMQLNGGLTAAGAAAGRGGRVDVSSPLDIILAAPGAPAQAGKLVLNTTLLSAWNAESLLIGGERVSGNGTSTVTVRTNNLTLDNSGAPLSGADVVLVAKENLTLAAGAAITQTGTQAAADAFVITGDGAAVRVSGVATAQTSRTGVTASAVPQININAGAVVSGRSITLDSTSATNLNPAALLTAQAVNLSSGRLSLLLDNPGALQPDAGMIISEAILGSLQNAGSLSLLSYSSFDIYGTGTFAAQGALALRAGEIRGFNHGAGTVNITATSVLLDNLSNGIAPGAVAGMSGMLNVTAGTITLGQNALVVDQFSTVTLNATGSLRLQGAGSFATQGDLALVTPYITGASGTTHSVSAGAALTMTNPGASSVTPAGLQLGAQVSFSGASVAANSDILLPSGVLSLRARTGSLTVGGRLDAGGRAVSFYDVVKHTNGGSISLAADVGAVTVASGGTVNVSAAATGGNAGTFSVSSPGGLFTMNGALLGSAGIGGIAGTAEIDVGSISSFTALNDVLNNGNFTAGRNLRIRNGSVVIDGTVNAHRFLLGVDQGSITVNGTINAAGQTGGRIDLIASGSVVINSGAVLTVAGQNFDSAGKGGAVRLEAGSYVNNTTNTAAVLDVRTGSTINLSVAANNAGSALRGQFTGTLHLRAPQSAGNTEVTAIQAINGAIQDASSIVVEGYRVYDLTGSGDISTTVQNNIQSNGVSFGGNSAAISTRLLANNAGLASQLVVMPGAEVVNRTGNLTLGTSTSAVAADWNLATFRYGPKNAPGVLTLRAFGNLEFYNTLSDGFNVLTAAPTGYSLVERMWLATLTSQNNNLPVNVQSWSYRMAAGADFSAVNFREVRSLETLAANTGSLLLGKDAGQAIPTTLGDNALTRLVINPTNGTNVNTTANRFQVIRTGTGDIEIFTGRDVQLLNQFATIYSAGVAVPTATTVFAAGDFVVPIVAPSAGTTPPQTGLGAVQQLYAAQYSRAGGNVTVEAGADIVHLTKDSGGNLIMDSQRQLPNNWLMRRGYVDSTGNYGTIRVSAGGIQTVNDAAASTSWWVNFSNFFDGVAALGGGNVTLKAGHDVQNVSAHAPTNARAARGTPSAASLLELGGGDVTVVAGRNIDGGVYYVERGSGILQAGGQITTNSTRSPSLGRLGVMLSIFPEATWLPTTLFVGRSSFDVSARGDVLMGPVANTMLLPQGVNNKHWYKTYFSTYAADSGVTVASLGGDITIRQAVVRPDSGSSESILGLWMRNELELGNSSAAFYQPWLRLAESTTGPFATLSTLMPGTLRATAHSGDINLVGRMNLSPSAQGTIELLAAGAVNGLAPMGVSSTLILGAQTNVWDSATLNLSDADPASIPSMLSPYAFYQTYFNPAVPNNNTVARVTGSTFLSLLDSTFAESGSTTGSYASSQVKQRLHAAGLLHLNDTQPVRIYAAGGDLSGLTLFSPKAAMILAQKDITDIAFYIQNVRSSDVSIVSSGRDIVAYNANSALRTLAVSPGNFTAIGETPNSGDIQISGPGSLQVLAGRDLNLGTGSNNPDGTGVGITSIGNGRNPSLPFAGADVIVAAGMGGAAVGLGGSGARFDAFINALMSEINPAPGGSAPGVFDTRRYLRDLAEMLQKNGLRGLSVDILETDPLGDPLTFEPGENVVFPGQTGSLPVEYPNSVDLNDPSLTAEQRNQLGLALYFIALKNAGRDRNNPDSPDVNTYRAGYEAIQSLFSVPSPAALSNEQLRAVADRYLYDGKLGTGEVILNLEDPDVKASVIGRLLTEVPDRSLVEGNIAGHPDILGTRDPETRWALTMLLDEARPAPGYAFSGNIQTQARDIRTKSGGNISIFAPGGDLQLASTLIGETLAPPGIITESGGSISIFADQDISIGIARIFTLRGGDINIWSTAGNIAAGSSSKTVQSAPPTRVLIDPQSANVATDLAGLATGGGIGVLATVAGVAPGNVDLIAPIGAVDAGDAGIRATGNLNIAANVVLNAANISVNGSTGGTPAAASVASPSLASVSGANAATAATNNAPSQAAEQARSQQASSEQTPSIISVEVIGYGGGAGDDDEEERKRRRNQPGE